MKSYTIQEALIKLYNNTRIAPLTLEEHDNNRAYVDVLAQALNITIQWVQPKVEEDSKDAAIKLEKTVGDTNQKQLESFTKKGRKKN